MEDLLWKITSGIRVVRLFKNWFYPFLSHFGLLKNAEMVYVLCDGIKYQVPSTDDWWTIFNIYLAKLFTPVGHEIQPGYTVVDIGANVGVFSIFAATRAPDVKVVSYEPHPQNFELLLKNIKLNDLKNIKAFPLAVVGSGEKRKLFIGGSDRTHSLIEPTANSKPKSYIEVNCITLKEIIGLISKCDLLKINCEGAEYEILLGTPQEYLNKVGRMSMDCHNITGHSGYDLKNYLEKMGFEVRLVKPPTTETHTYLFATRKM